MVSDSFWSVWISFGMYGLPFKFLCKAFEMLLNTYEERLKCFCNRDKENEGIKNASG